jgi:RHS repeat-associated protein
MPAHLYDTSAHALPRVRSRAQERLRAPSRSWPSSAGCKTASKKKFSFSRRFPHARCALAQNAPREFALFPVASMLGATNKNFSWLYAQAQTNATLGTSYTYGDGSLPAWAMLAETGNGAANSSGRTEYIWLPTDDGSAIPVALFRNNRYYNIHSDHLGTPRIVTDDQAKPVWQWAYSAFGDNKPTGVLKATTNPNAAITNQPTLLQATGVGTVLSLRYPGQYFDSETGLAQNFMREYMSTQGRYTQPDSIGLRGGSNRFLYANADGINYYDPDGHQAQAAVALCFTTPAGMLVCGAAACALTPGCAQAVTSAASTVVQTVKDLCTSDDPSPQDCQDEWRRAENVCFEWMQELEDPKISARRRRQLLDLTGGSMSVCKMGQVSQACGGNKVDKPPKRKR